MPYALGSPQAEAIRLFEIFLSTSDPRLVERFAAGDLQVTFVQPSPLAKAIRSESIEDAYAHLSGLSATNLKKYYAAPTITPHPTPPPAGNAAKGPLIDSILIDAFGHTYAPPPTATVKAATLKLREPRTGAKNPAKLNPGELISHLRTISTAAEGRAALVLGRAKRPYQDLADALEIKYNGNTTVAMLIDEIVRLTVESRLSYSTLQRLGER